MKRKLFIVLLFLLNISIVAAFRESEVENAIVENVEPSLVAIISTGHYSYELYNEEFQITTTLLDEDMYTFEGEYVATWFIEIEIAQIKEGEENETYIAYTNLVSDNNPSKISGYEAQNGNVEIAVNSSNFYDYEATTLLVIRPTFYDNNQLLNDTIFDIEDIDNAITKFSNYEIGTGWFEGILFYRFYLSVYVGASGSYVERMAEDTTATEQVVNDIQTDLTFYLITILVPVGIGFIVYIYLTRK